MKSKQFKTDWAGRELKVEVGQLAGQANGSILLTYGQTTILATAVMDKDPANVDYMPLSVNYEEKFYAAGKIKSGRFIKREGRPSDESILTGRMIDRTLRPGFNQKIRNAIQLALTVLSFDKENDPDIPALIAASLAIGISDIPWNGLIGGMRVGRTSNGQAGEEQEWVLNPTYSKREESDFDLVVAGKKDRINMLEGGATQVPEEVLLSAIEFAQPQIKKIVEFQESIVKEIGKEKAELEIKELDKDLAKQIEDYLSDKLENAVYQPENVEKSKSILLLERELIKALDENGENEAQIRETFNEMVDELVHEKVTKEDKRPDGRKLDEVREIKAQTGILDRTHGTGLFNRGSTQALSVVTLGGPSEGQTIDGMEEEKVKNFMHHYNFPPYSVGETGRIGFTNRREIGHGALAEKALFPLIPSNTDFPYTIRLVSEILSSNGSSSMASVSGSSLALMDAGVPIKTHVSGIAMGLIMGPNDSYKILTDIQGPEDHHGDMDCKVAGTKHGVTACQMDVKIEGVTLEILKEAFKAANKARLGIIGTMEKAIKEPRKELSPLAPRILTIQIDKDKIRDVIGPGGKVINEIIDSTGVKIDIDDDGLVNITATEEEAGNKALEWVKNLTREVKPGETFQGKVVKIADFGAFVQILPNQDGLVHISELADYHVEKVEDVVKMGQVVVVKVKKVDELGRINLTLKGAKEENKK